MPERGKRFCASWSNRSWPAKIAECMFGWYWLADACEDAGLTFVLAHALYLRAIHGGKVLDRLHGSGICHDWRRTPQQGAATFAAGASQRSQANGHVHEGGGIVGVSSTSNDDTTRPFWSRNSTLKLGTGPPMNIPLLGTVPMVRVGGASGVPSPEAKRS
jgi:hypothetical protein